MKRLPITQLKLLALKKLREHRRCHDVEDISLCPMTSDGSSPNWAISCGFGGSDKIAASKAALYVEQETTRSYEMTDDET